MSEDGSGSTADPWVRQIGRQFKQPLPERRSLLHGLWFLLWLAMLAFIVFVREYAGQRAWWPLGLALILFVLYSLFLLLTYLLPRFPSAGEWLVDHGVTYLTAVMMMTLVLTLLAWWVVNFHWTTEEQLTSQESTSLGNDLTVSAAYPAVALIRPETDTLTLSFTPVPTTTRTITATITLDGGLTFANAPGVAESEVVVDLSPHLPARTRLRVVNDETVANLWRTAESDITVAFRDASVSLGEVTVPVTVEGRRGFAMRRFVTSAIDRASPVIFLLLLVLPGLATLVQKAIDARTSALHASRKAQFEGMVENIRKQLLLTEPEDGKKIEAANKEYDQLRVTKYEAFAPSHRVELKELLELAGWDVENKQVEDKKEPIPLRSDHPPMRVLELARRWPLEFAGVLPLAHRHYQKHLMETADEAARTYWLRLMRGAQERSFELRLEDHPRLARELAPLMLDWTIQPIDKRLQPPFPPSTYRFSDVRLKTPFALDSVEEERFLLDGGAFWGGHDFVKNRLRVLDSSYAVFGDPGSGCGALATMLSSGRISSPNYHPDYLYIKLGGVASRLRVLRTIAELVLEWLLRHPAYWRHCTPAGKGRVAQLLLSQGRDFVLMQIETAQLRAQDRPPESLFAQEEAKYSRGELQRDLEAIRLFMDAYSPIPGVRKWASGPQMIAAMLTATRALKFERVIFAHETTQDQVGWLDDLFLNNLGVWHDMDLRLCLFPQTDVEWSKLEQSRMLQRFELRWDRPDFEKMLKWRYERFLVLSGLHQGSRPPHKDSILACLGESGYDGVWESLLDNSRLNGSYNPDRFMRLWRLAAGEKMHGEKITQDDVNAAVSQLEGQS